MPLGHGAALSYPDRPYLIWSYKGPEGEKVVRNNPEEFIKAAQAMCTAMQRYRVGDPKADVSGLSPDATDKIGLFFLEFTDEDGRERHKKWLEEIARGSFGFPPVRLKYKDKGVASWKYQAIGTRRHKDRRTDRFAYDPSFLGSDWKLFHDALHAHRFAMLNTILPKYGICAA